MKRLRLVLTKDEIEQIKVFLGGSRARTATMSSGQWKRFSLKAKKFQIVGEKLFYIEDGHYLEAIADDDNESLDRIFGALHEEWNHIGMTKLYLKSRELYMGFNRERLYQRVRACPVCQLYIPLKHTPAIRPIIADQTWDHVQADCIDLRKYASVNDGYGWMLTVIDIFSKYLCVFPMMSKSAESVYAAFRKLFTMVGPPVMLQTDNGTEFKNARVSDLLTSLNIKHSCGRPRHPQSQGAVERVNQTISRIVAKMTHGKPERRWIDDIDMFVLKYNETWHRATGRTPMHMFFLRGNRNITINNSQFQNMEIEGINYSIGLNPVLYDTVDLSEFGEHDLISSDVFGDFPTEPIEIRGETEPEKRITDEHREAYILRMCNDADVHSRRRDFACGDRVLIKKDFDTNPTTRRNKLEGFYEDGIWTVIARLARNTFLIGYNGQEKQVHKDILKHYKELEE